MDIHVDRGRELDCLASMVNAPEDLRRIMLLGGVEGSGKTAFLNKAFSLYSGVTAVAWVDLEQKSGPIELMDHIATEFGAQGVALKQYRAAAASTGLPDVSVEFNKSNLTHSPVDVAIRGGVSREDRIRDLFLRLMNDLDKWRGPMRRLILVDNYEGASPDMSRWLAGTLIPGLAYNRSTVCVITGRQPPVPSSPPIRQKSEHFTLLQLEEHDIKQWLVAVGLARAADDETSFLWKATRGLPGILAILIGNLVFASSRGPE
jgi:hypothetical protein